MAGQLTGAGMGNGAIFLPQSLRDDECRTIFRLKRGLWQNILGIVGGGMEYVLLVPTNIKATLAANPQPVM
jgi:hypothetical protein